MMTSSINELQTANGKKNVTLTPPSNWADEYHVSEISRMALDLRLSRVRTGVAAMGEECNYQLDIMKLWRKKG